MFDEQVQWDIFVLTAVTMHLGNVDFSALTVANMDACEVSNEGVVRTAAKLLQVFSHM